MSTTLAATSWHLSAGSLVAGGLQGRRNGAGYGTPNLREGGDYGLQSSTLYVCVRDCTGIANECRLPNLAAPGKCYHALRWTWHP